MPLPEIPLHLSLTGRPLLLYPNVAPELNLRLQAAYNGRTARLSDRLLRRSESRPSNPIAATQPQSRINLNVATQAAQRDPYIEVLTIEGPLLNKAQYFNGVLCIDGYDRIGAVLTKAGSDPSCVGIFLDMDSPGGMVNGCFELADVVADIAATKPVIAYTAGLCCSAAYAIASQARELHGSLTALIGSIGVIYGRYDFTDFNEKTGVKIDFITSGSQKSWGHPDTPMGDDEQSATQTEINTLADMFFDRVARARDLNEDAIAALEAGTFLTDAAIKHRIADQRLSRADALARLTEMISNPDSGADPDPIPAPAAPEPAADKTDPSVTTATHPSTKPKEKPMSNLNSARRRASLAVTVAALAMTMATNMASSDELDDEALTSAIEDETEKDIETMDDDDVEAMDDEDTEAMEEDDDLTAMEEDEIEGVEDDEEATPADAIKASASRVAIMAVAIVKKASSSAPKPTGDPVKDAVAADRQRASAIQALPEAKGREAVAAQLAAKGLSVDDARDILAASPKASKRAFNPPSPKLGVGGKRQKATAFDQAQEAAADRMRSAAGQ